MLCRHFKSSDSKHYILHGWMKLLHYLMISRSKIAYLNVSTIQVSFGGSKTSSFLHDVFEINGTRQSGNA